ncbi:MAG TPA: 2Fe-2S iron-sulfur cluster-binding protein [Trebonia sp.]|nr:2Fe-2S iron-sulfur cluster-binding protein [Trebonia sp.]
MPKVVYLIPDGTRQVIDGNAGDSVMETAVRNGVPGIVAECGGACSCATCHVYVDEGFLGRLEEKEEIEDDMLDGTASPRLPNSRLSCQLKLRDALDGITVTIPLAQI